MFEKPELHERRMQRDTSVAATRLYPLAVPSLNGDEVDAVFLTHVPGVKLPKLFQPCPRPQPQQRQPAVRIVLPFDGEEPLQALAS
jgi:hypothetical protein